MAITIATGPAFSTDDPKRTLDEAGADTNLILSRPLVLATNPNSKDQLGISSAGLATGSNVRFRTPLKRPDMLCLGTTQQKVFDIVHEHLRSMLRGRPPPQLLMIVCGASGSSKITLLKAIHASFKRHGAVDLIAKTRYSALTKCNLTSLLDTSSSYSLIQTIIHACETIVGDVKDLLHRIGDNFTAA
ncbi:hypothetical protein DFH07DRAFT_771184 [Mycena maculata]|uniref:Uncharacterized protein n=1 Tax=Mycena maculata TaxID=230809 RepID=A0AAD7JFU5_9AGAR|nr:hypothetical protein DFH07DRAFT_771184 [Mycena maculata]